MSPPRPPTSVGPFFFDEEGIRGARPCMPADTVLLATRGMRSNTVSSTYDSPCQDYIHVLGLRRHPPCLSPTVIKFCVFHRPPFFHTPPPLEAVDLSPRLETGLPPLFRSAGNDGGNDGSFGGGGRRAGRNELFASQFS